MKLKWKLPCLISLTVLISCIHITASKTQYTVTEDHKEALLYHDGTYSHLILKTNVEGEVLPDSLAWVIPIESKPNKIKEAPKGLFKDLYNLTPDYSYTRDTSVPFLFGCSAAPIAQNMPIKSIKVGPEQQVGAYTVTTIEIQNTTDDGAALNNWLVNNQFGKVKGSSLEYYNKPGRCFICVKVNEVKAEHGTVNLPALHITYPSKKMSLPLKFSSHSGEFDVDLYVLTKGEIDVKAFKDQHLFHHSSEDYKIGNGKTQVLDKLSIPKAKLHRFTGKKINSEYKMVLNMIYDPELMGPDYMLTIIDN